VLALDYSGARSRRLLITVVTTTAMITSRMPVHPHQRFGIGAMPIRAITLRYPNARFLGDKLFSNSKKVLARLAGRETVIQSIGLDPVGRQLLTIRCSSFKHRENCG
jgi:hypothetical protein